MARKKTPSGLTMADVGRMDDETLDELHEEASEKGKSVFSMSFDSGGMGGGCWGEIRKYRGLYFAASDNGGERGPWATFAEALRESGLASYGGPPSLTCSEVDAPTLLGMIEIHEPGPTEVNGRCWVYDEKTGQLRITEDV